MAAPARLIEGDAPPRVPGLRAYAAEWADQYRWPAVLLAAYGAALLFANRLWSISLWRPIIGGPPEVRIVLAYMAKAIVVAVILIVVRNVAISRGSLPGGLRRAYAGPLAPCRLAEREL